MLANKERGYLVFIEEVTRPIDFIPLRREKETVLPLQGRIDHGHHANEAGRALQQTLELDKAVTAALEMVDLEVIQN